MTQTLDEKLKQRLKDLYDDPREYSPGQIAEASGMALDRIEELEEKILSATMDGYDMAKHEYRDRIEELEVKLAEVGEMKRLLAMDKINLRGELAWVEGKLAKAEAALPAVHRHTWNPPTNFGSKEE